MSILRYDATRRVLVVTKGHPFQRDAFFGALERIDAAAFTAVEQPAAQAFFDPARAAEWQAILLYDMPGVDLLRGARSVDPPDGLRERFEALVAGGCGLVFLHHAIAGWPSWPEYHDWIGARFLYAPDEVRGRSYPDSGYRFDVEHHLTPVDPSHPVVAGLEQGFDIRDECYLCPVFEEDVVPLLKSDYAFTDENFYSSAEAVAGRLESREGWSHPAGCNLVAWARQIGPTKIVTILLGDGPSAYENPAFRRLVGNAVGWVAETPGRAP
jgi:hypothetical protein